MNLLDCIPSISFRTQLRGWMDNFTFKEWLNESHAVSKDISDLRRYDLLDTCSGHRVSDQVQSSFDAIMTILVLLPAKSTHWSQPLDTFFIQKLVSVWRQECEKEKMNLFTAKNWSDSLRSFRKLINPEQAFYTRLAIRGVNKLNSVIDGEDNLLPRKAMIQCGLSPKTKKQWKLTQLFKHLQKLLPDTR